MDELHGVMPALYCTSEAMGYEQKFSPYADVKALIEQGHVEISARTANALGLPT